MRLYAPEYYKGIDIDLLKKIIKHLYLKDPVKKKNYSRVSIARKLGITKNILFRMLHSVAALSEVDFERVNHFMKGHYKIPADKESREQFLFPIGRKPNATRHKPYLPGFKGYTIK